ncbi:MAG TPA: deoxyhypusine synthase [Phycisphaerales bacterium]|nr:deoxyhypusine synthase [Phycisphaerales bacterium]
MQSKTSWTRKELLSTTIEHVDITSFDARPILDAYARMAFQSRNLASAARIYDMMLADTSCGVILTLAGSLISAGLKKALITLVEHNMVDAIVSTGANIVDQDFFEGLGFRHYIAPGSVEAPPVDDVTLRELMIDRITDTYISEEELRACDDATKEVFDSMPPGSHSSRECVEALGAYLAERHPRAESLVATCYRKRVPIYVPAFSDCSAGFGIVLHQQERLASGKPFVAFDSGKDFRELTQIKLSLKDTGLLMLGGGVPKNFAQDIVVAAELLAEKSLTGDIGAMEHGAGGISMHKYAVQLTVADPRDGALSGSTLREASSWGKVDVVHEQMVFGELTTTFPLLASDAYHRGSWRKRQALRLADVVTSEPLKV